MASREETVTFEATKLEAQRRANKDGRTRYVMYQNGGRGWVILTKPGKRTPHETVQPEGMGK